MFSSIIRCFQVEWLKSRHTPLLLVHILFPVIGAGIFAGYPAKIPAVIYKVECI